MLARIVVASPCVAFPLRVGARRANAALCSKLKSFSTKTDEDATNFGLDGDDENSSMLSRTVNGILSCGVDGNSPEGYPWPLCGSKQLASEYLLDTQFSNTQSRIDNLIKWESAKTFGSGFLTGAAGVFALPATLPLSLFSSWTLQARVSGAIAELHGFDTQDPRTRSGILLSLLGKKGGLEIEGDSAGTSHNIDNAAAIKASREFFTVRVPMSALMMIQRATAATLLSRAGGRAVSSGAARAVPLIGGMVSGSIDAVSLKMAANSADEIFRKMEPLPTTPKDED